MTAEKMKAPANEKKGCGTLNETNYAEYEKRISLDDQRIIKPAVKIEGLTEEEAEKVRCAFNEFCEKIKAI